MQVRKQQLELDMEHQAECALRTLLLIFLKYPVKYILLINVGCEQCSFPMLMLLVKNHCPLKHHRSVSKRVSNDKPWEDYRDRWQGGFSNFVRLLKFVVGYLFPQSLSIQKCPLPYICSM